MAWDPKTYLGFASERTRPAIELLARIAVESPESVADFGCGPGNSTALLRERWPNAAIEGIDNSSEMIATARKSGVRADWILSDMAIWIPTKRYDVIFANAALHWLGDYQKLLPRLMGFLGKSGTLAFQIPRNFHSPCHTLMRAVACEGSWAAKLKNVRRIDACSPQECFSILEGNAAYLEIWETEYLQVLSGEDAVYRWMSGTGLRPFADALEGDKREAFLREYRSRLSLAYPVLASGKTLFPFRRLFAIAKK